MKKWHERNILSVRHLMEAMTDWHREGYVDPAVWEKLICNKVNPTLMPAPSVLQSLPPPPGGQSHSALQHLPHPPEGARHPLEFQYRVNYFSADNFLLDIHEFEKNVDVCTYCTQIL